MTESSSLDPEFLAILRCPACGGGLAQESGGLRCQGPGCRRLYPVRDGIPFLVIEEALEGEGVEPRRDD